MSNPVMSSVQFAHSITERRSAEDLRSIVQVKRFLELLTGDSSFREQIKANPTRSTYLAMKRGIDLDLSKFSSKFKTETSTAKIPSDPPEFPLLVLWTEWVQDWLTFVRLIREDGYWPGADSRFNAWRKRQIKRVNIEFGASQANLMSHSVFSFELSKGCSVGCWFCGFSAESLKGHYQRNPKNVKLWRNVLSTAVDLFGSAVQTGSCYWATEPFDNPNYLDFIQDYLDIVGIVPQTTSAAPTRDLVWTRRLMQMHELHPSVPSRFSIVSSRVLRDLHSTFSAEELLRYELIMQLRSSTYGKARAGKTLRKKVSAESGRHKGLQVYEEVGSIACMSGYLVNMVEGTIQLVSPTLACDRWPLGYRVHASGTFSTANEFGDFIERSISERMPSSLPLDQPLSYRDGLGFESLDNGFALSSGFAVYSFSGSGFVRQLGAMIAQGGSTTSQIIGKLMDEGADTFGVRGTLDELFHKGFLEDLPS